MTITRRPMEERFWEKVRKGDGCWEWTASTYKNGYGQIGKPGREGNMGAHVYSFILHYGPVPDGLQVNHHCDNKRCVRPDHLYAGTVSQNGLDMRRSNRCIRGHEFIHRNGRRDCQECNTIRARTYRKRMRDERMEDGY